MPRWMTCSRDVLLERPLGTGQRELLGFLVPSWRRAPVTGNRRRRPGTPCRPSLRASRIRPGAHARPQRSAPGQHLDVARADRGDDGHHEPPPELCRKPRAPARRSCSAHLAEVSPAGRAAPTSARSAPAVTTTRSCSQTSAQHRVAAAGSPPAPQSARPRRRTSRCVMDLSLPAAEPRARRACSSALSQRLLARPRSGSPRCSARGRPGTTPARAPDGRRVARARESPRRHHVQKSLHAFAR